jgi:hypothetical protein
VHQKAKTRYPSGTVQQFMALFYPGKQFSPIYSDLKLSNWLSVRFL